MPRPSGEDSPTPYSKNTHTHTHTHTHVRTLAHTHRHTHTHTHTRTHARTHARTYTHPRTDTHTRTHARTHARTHTHTHTHTHTLCTKDPTPAALKRRCPIPDVQKCQSTFESHGLGRDMFLSLRAFPMKSKRKIPHRKRKKKNALAHKGTLRCFKNHVRLLPVCYTNVCLSVSLIHTCTILLQLCKVYGGGGGEVV